MTVRGCDLICPAIQDATDKLAKATAALEEIAKFAEYAGNGGVFGPRLSGMASAGNIAVAALKDIR